jgi:deoxyribodipyrimidine photolyase-related protein
VNGLPHARHVFDSFGLFIIVSYRYTAPSMKEAAIIYPHQLFLEHPALSPERPVYLVEEELLLARNPIHRQKILFLLKAMDAYEDLLTAKGYAVTRLRLADYPDARAVFRFINDSGIECIHCADTTDDYLERAIIASGIERVWYESPLFILPRQEAVERYGTSKRHMARFYEMLRIDRHVLVDEEGKPVGGRFSFDGDNRKKVPKGKRLPADIFVTTPTEDEKNRVDAFPAAEKYGEHGTWLPHTHAEAEAALDSFLKERFAHFGDYEDAMSTEGVRLWHSALSPLMNIGLLTATQVLDAVLAYAETHGTPVNSLEGFVRQVLGWREFIRASYETDGRLMRTRNFFGNTENLSAGFWSGETGLLPLDQVIRRAIATGYTHHIERLMIAGNAMLLMGINPHQAYRWFMGLYVDAYDWVMVPNVYGMSQFADGGIFATKPYICGSNYIRKMSDFPAGEWEEIWTALYWAFIEKHADVFAANHRMSMMPRMLSKMTSAHRAELRAKAAEYLTSIGVTVREG